MKRCLTDPLESVDGAPWWRIQDPPPLYIHPSAPWTGVRTPRQQPAGGRSPLEGELCPVSGLINNSFGSRSAEELAAAGEAWRRPCAAHLAVGLWERSPHGSQGEARAGVRVRTSRPTRIPWCSRGCPEPCAFCAFCAWPLVPHWDVHGLCSGPLSHRSLWFL